MYVYIYIYDALEYVFVMLENSVSYQYVLRYDMT